MRRYFKLQILDGTKKINYVDEVLDDNRITSHIDYAGKEFETLTKGDIGIIHKGNSAHCLIEIIEKIKDNNSINGMNFGINYRIKKLSFFNSIPNELKFKIDNKYIGHSGTFINLKDSNSKTYKFLQHWLDYIKPTYTMKNIIQLLKHKKQIILQGPPGTGKTRLAKEIGAVLTKPSIQNYEQKLESFFKTYKVNDAILKKRKNISNLKQEFLDKFPKNELNSLSLEKYALGLDDKDGFSYWLEYILHETGRYNGTATKNKIYWDTKDETYKKSGFIKDIVDDNEAMQQVADLLNRIVSEEFDKEFPIGKGFVLKMLNTYHPSKYFPINSESCLNNVLALFEIDTKDLSYIEKNIKVQEYFLSMKEQYNTDVTNYEFMYFLFDNFDLKGSVKIENKTLVAQGKSQLIQFHPSYTYEDFVRGITVKSTADGIVYITENKILADFAVKAIDNPSANYVLIIDEINRANLSSVLGELIYALEYRGEPVESMYEKEGEGTSLVLPSNLFIIGTMNTADRSVGQIDYAIRRRFAFVDVLPKVLTESSLNENRKEADPKLFFNMDKFKEVSKLFVKNDILTDTKLEASEHLSEEFKSKDVWLGHSYFIHEEGNFDMHLNFEIKPILREYVTDGILKESALDLIDNL